MSRLRFTLFEPTAVSAHHLFHLAREAERVGFDSFSLNDGTFQMQDTRGIYPYSSAQTPNWDRGAPFYEPLTILPAIAMHTERLQVYPAVIKLPLHHPLTLFGWVGLVLLTPQMVWTIRKCTHPVMVMTCAILLETR